MTPCSRIKSSVAVTSGSEPSFSGCAQAFVPTTATDAVVRTKTPSRNNSLRVVSVFMPTPFSFRILHFKQFAKKTAEIVNRAWGGTNRDGSVLNVAVH